jgi:hypothetical protein
MSIWENIVWLVMVISGGCLIIGYVTGRLGARRSGRRVVRQAKDSTRITDENLIKKFDDKRPAAIRLDTAGPGDLPRSEEPLPTTEDGWTVLAEGEFVRIMADIPDSDHISEKKSRGVSRIRRRPGRKTMWPQGNCSPRKFPLAPRPMWPVHRMLCVPW